VTIDGKVLRGSLAPGKDQALHLLAAHVPAHGIVSMQAEPVSSENEPSVAPPVLKCLDLRAKAVRGDAMFTQPELSMQIVEAGGDHIWLTIANQPRLGEAIAQLLASPIWAPGWRVLPNNLQTAKAHNDPGACLDTSCQGRGQVLV